MAAVVTAVTVAGTLLGGLGQVSSMMQQSASNKYNASIAKQNARLAREQGEANKAAKRREGEQFLARQRASAAQGGILNSKSTESIMEQNVREIERDLSNIEYEAKLRAQGLLAQAQGYEVNAKASSKGAVLSGVTGILNAGASGFDTWKEYNRKDTGQPK